MSATRAPVSIVHPLSATLDGERVGPLRLPPDGPARVLIGRGIEADWRIPDRRVSRAHAMFVRRGNDWFLADHQSQHGTFLNGTPLGSGEMLPLSAGDQIGFGPWLCRWTIEGESYPDRPQRTMIGSIDGAAGPRGSDTRISTFMRRELEGLSQQRLAVLLSAMRRMAGARGRDDVARVLIETVGQVTAAARTYVLRLLDDDSVEFLGIDPERTRDLPAISRSLVRATIDGGAAQLHDSSNMVEGVSMMQLEIRSALCTPLLVNGRPDCFLYLDSRAGEERLSKDAVSFCAALADIGGLSIERALSAQVAELREQMERDLRAARAAQQMLLPARAGQGTRHRYAYECIAGRHVAGDLFDLIELPGGRIAFWLGDVTGKGVAAGLLMSATQMQLRALLRRGATLIEAMNETNENLCERTEADKFVTLLSGSWDPARGELELVDAGHGSCCIAAPNDPPACVRVDGGMPLGVGPNADYRSTTIPTRPGMRLVTFSDGLIEQRDTAGVEFGLPRVLELILPIGDPADDVRRLIQAARRHTPGSFGDDLTIASIEFDRSAAPSSP